MHELLNQRGVRKYVREVDPELNVSSSYLRALNVYLMNQVRKHAFIVRGRNTLTHNEVEWAGWCSPPPREWKRRKKWKPKRRRTKRPLPRGRKRTKPPPKKKRRRTR